MNFTSNWVYVFISHRVGSRDIAEDLTSEVFLKALANLHRFEWRSVPFAVGLKRSRTGSGHNEIGLATRCRATRSFSDTLVYLCFLELGAAAARLSG